MDVHWSAWVVIKWGSFLRGAFLGHEAIVPYPAAELFCLDRAWDEFSAVGAFVKMKLMVLIVCGEVNDMIFSSDGVIIDGGDYFFGDFRIGLGGVMWVGKCFECYWGVIDV